MRVGAYLSEKILWVGAYSSWGLSERGGLIESLRYCYADVSNNVTPREQTFNNREDKVIGQKFRGQKVFHPQVRIYFHALKH